MEGPSRDVLTSQDIPSTTGTPYGNPGHRSCSNQNNIVQTVYTSTIDWLPTFAIAMEWAWLWHFSTWHNCFTDFMMPWNLIGAAKFLAVWTHELSCQLFLLWLGNMQGIYMVTIHYKNIIDSICRDSADTQYMTIQKTSQYLKNGKHITTYHSSSSTVMTNKNRSGTRKHCEGTNPRTHKTGQMFFLFLLSSFFRWASSILREPLTLVYTWNSSNLYGAVHNTITSSQLWSLVRHS